MQPNVVDFLEHQSLRLWARWFRLSRGRHIGVRVDKTGMWRPIAKVFPVGEHSRAVYVGVFGFVVAAVLVDMSQ